MRVAGEERRSIWREGAVLHAIDQRRLPERIEVARLDAVDDVVRAIRDMWVRGAPLIGVTAAYGLALAAASDASDGALARARERLLAARPTAVNPRWTLDRMAAALAGVPVARRAEAAWAEADRIAEADVATCRRIGEQGVALLGRGARVLTHCNAGWLACVDWGTALAPIYLAHRRGLPVHVWVSETRPRNQGALTAWELGQEGVPHTVIVDSAAGWLLARGEVDLCLVGSDRTTARGDVVNKIGTYMKALAARAHGVPFYAALPTSTIDLGVTDGTEVPIEERDAGEVTRDAPARNPAFDVTPAALVTGLVTERGVCAATAEGIAGLPA